jgi:hypothetical protein
MNMSIYTDAHNCAPTRTHLPGPPRTAHQRSPHCTRCGRQLTPAWSFHTRGPHAPRGHCAASAAGAALPARLHAQPHHQSRVARSRAQCPGQQQPGVKPTHKCKQTKTISLVSTSAQCAQFVKASMLPPGTPKASTTCQHLLCAGPT